MATDEGRTPGECARPMTPDEKAWLKVAEYALYRAQRAAGELMADDGALLRRYRSAHNALADLFGGAA